MRKLLIVLAFAITSSEASALKTLTLSSQNVRLGFMENDLGIQEIKANLVVPLFTEPRILRDQNIEIKGSLTLYGTIVIETGGKLKILGKNIAIDKNDNRWSLIDHNYDIIINNQTINALDKLKKTV